MTDTTPSSRFLTLPAELRLAILDFALSSQNNGDGFCNRSPVWPGGLYLDENYSSSSSNLGILLTCRQFRHDFTVLAFSRIPFVITDIYSSLLTRLNILQSHQISAIRHLTFVAGARQFREMVHWHRYPFNVEALRLDSLKVVLHRSAHWHYPSDFTSDMVSLLRRLQHVQSLSFFRNGANVKGFFKTWYNRLIGLVLKEDHYQRYDAPSAPNVEDTWWDWGFDDSGEWFELQAREKRALLAEEEYLEGMRPMVERLMREMEREEVDPDPRARNGWA
ncbi:hypothetical protein K469DRAFT_558543 [Zopfia rhizophila CBS 207.26]|uniref:Uncharacterized protein n=1 Tax=Zopfia rhizophila CBS 207.26 TaxID=1314779 RepID=A0A6A6EKW2_9PEZI|nr:hypothetical protein K469DRAFT_558543 [Zopfia rhizophila CBS 207.26]